MFNSNMLSYLFCSIHINEIVFRSLSLTAIRKVMLLTVTTYMCHKWPRICSVCSGDTTVLISPVITHIDKTISLYLLFMFCRFFVFVIFLLAIVLCVLLWCMLSKYLFGIFTLFSRIYKWKSVLYNMYAKRQKLMILVMNEWSISKW